MFKSKALIITLLGEIYVFCKENLALMFYRSIDQSSTSYTDKGKNPEKIASFCYVQTIQQRKVICRASAPFTSGLLGNLIEIYEPKP